jgi:GNAT superfamily N-acetyltransferase
MTDSEYTFYPLTPARWKDVESLFGPRGACAGCWCMAWRLKRSVYESQKGTKNKNAFRKIVGAKKKPGILAYHKGMPVGWCSVGPRGEFPSLGRSRVLKPVDDRPVWSVVCFFIHRDYRRAGLSVLLLKAVVDHVRKAGGKMVEGYPIDSADDYPDTFAWTGLASAFRKAGFRAVARRSPTRPIMRFEIR